MRVVDFNDGSSVDLGKVVYVGPVVGDPAYLRYTIRFVGGGRLEIYETRTGDSRHMERHKFVELWKGYLESTERVN